MMGFWDSEGSGSCEEALGPGVLVKAFVSELPLLRFFSKKTIPAAWWQF